MAPSVQANGQMNDSLGHILSEVHHSSFIIHHSSFIIHHSSFIIHHSSFIFHLSSFINHSFAHSLIHSFMHHASCIMHRSSCISQSTLKMCGSLELPLQGPVRHSNSSAPSCCRPYIWLLIRQNLHPSIGSQHNRLDLQRRRLSCCMSPSTSLNTSLHSPMATSPPHVVR